jgi:hypothetical protein
MALVSIPWHPSAKDLRVFAGLQIVFFAIVAGMCWRRGGAIETAGAIVAVSTLIGSVGLLAPKLIRPIYLGWMLAVFPIGWIVSHLVLAAVYYLVVTPIGMLRRSGGRDPLERRIDPQAKSYWRERPPSPPPERYYRQF